MEASMAEHPVTRILCDPLASWKRYRAAWRARSADHRDFDDPHGPEEAELRAAEEAVMALPASPAALAMKLALWAHWEAIDDDRLWGLVAQAAKLAGLSPRVITSTWPEPRAKAA